MLRNFRLTLAYDGARFHGWQRQAGHATVQEQLELAAQRILRQPAAIVGASRTDAGVHALGQSAHLRIDTEIPLERLRRALGDRMPAGTALAGLAPAPLEFHAIRDAVGKLYRYRIHNAAPAPAAALSENTHWHVWHALDLDRMRAAGRLMTGTRDFAGFARTGSPRATTVRTVWHVGIAARGCEVRIDVEGDGFLYNQVRNMVGTLVEIGRGHWPPERIAAIIASRDRGTAGPTAPAHGLCLCWVRYPAAAIRPPAGAADAPPGPGIAGGPEPPKHEEP